MSIVSEPEGLRDGSMNKQSATERTIDAVVSLISDGSIVAGTRLPPEGDLASQIGVSRGSLREAVRVLDYLGIVDVRVGDGTYVTNLDGASLLGGLNLLGRVANDQTVLEILEIRRVIESAAAAMAASRITPEQLTELENVLAELSEETDEDRFVQLDIRFHDLIAAATGNVVLHGLCASFSARTQRVRLMRGRNGTEILRRSNAEHHDIYRHIKTGEATQAAAAVTSHIANVEHWLQVTSGDAKNEKTAINQVIDTYDLFNLGSQ
jgi:GntR family transcriptional repressor for pyruvate dehydrogenase complex